jgi:hypothetical protein
MMKVERKKRKRRKRLLSSICKGERVSSCCWKSKQDSTVHCTKWRANPSDHSQGKGERIEIERMRKKRCCFAWNRMKKENHAKMRITYGLMSIE